MGPPITKKTFLQKDCFFFVKKTKFKVKCRTFYRKVKMTFQSYNEQKKLEGRNKWNHSSGLVVSQTKRSVCSFLLLRVKLCQSQFGKNMLFFKIIINPKHDKIHKIRKINKVSLFCSFYLSVCWQWSPSHPWTFTDGGITLLSVF